MLPPTLLLFILPLLSRAEPNLLTSRSGFILPLQRRSGLQNPFCLRDQDSGLDDLFSPKFPEEELRNLAVKYQHATRLIAGIGITPDPELQKIIESTPPSLFDAVTSSAMDSIDPDSPGPIRPILATSGTAQVPLTDYVSGGMDILYYLSLKIGTPPQELTVDIDTGSSDLWVPSDCPSCTNKQFNKKASKTYSSDNTQFHITYGSGDVSAILAKDVVSIMGLTVQNQSFGAAAAASDDFNGYPNSGLVGLAFSSIAASRQRTLFENLIAQKTVSAPMFSVHLERRQAKGSEICFGCYNSAKATGPTVWHPVVSKTYWTISLDGMAVDNTLAPSNNVIAAIDSGTTLIYLPSNLAKRFYDMIPGSRQATEYGQGTDFSALCIHNNSHNIFLVGFIAFYAFPCDTRFTPSLVFGGSRYSISMSDFNQGRTSTKSTECIGGVLALGSGFPANLAIVGDEFMKSWYSTFDYSNGARVGFSPSVNNK